MLYIWNTLSCLSKRGFSQVFGVHPTVLNVFKKFLVVFLQISQSSWRNLIWYYDLFILKKMVILTNLIMHFKCVIFTMYKTHFLNTCVKGNGPVYHFFFYYPRFILNNDLMLMQLEILDADKSSWCIWPHFYLIK